MEGSWQRAALPLVLLGVLRSGPRHGYAVARRLEELGYGSVRGALLYPALNRLLERGLIEAEWVAGDGGPGRKTLHLTPAGEAELTRQTAAWRVFDTAVGQAVEGAEERVGTGPT